MLFSMRLKTYVSLCSGLTFLLVALPVSAADCGLTDYRAAFASADSVAVGKILSVGVNHLVTVRMNFVWKGFPWVHEYVTVPQDFVRNPDDNILFYMTAGPQGWHVDPCSHSAPLDEAPEFTLLLMASFGCWLAYLSIVRLIFFFRRPWVQSILPRMLIAFGCAHLAGVTIGQSLLSQLHFGILVHLAAIPLLTLLVFLILCALPIRIQSFALGLGIFSACTLVLMFLLQPADALILSAVGVLLADSLRHAPISAESADSVIRLKNSILLIISFALLVLSVGVMLYRWSA